MRAAGQEAGFERAPYASDTGRPLLLLLDGHSLAYRAFFALPADRFSTTTGQPTNAVYGFTSMLINLLRDERPTHIAVAFDVSRQTWRAAEYPEYKAQRTSSPNEFRGQVELMKDVLDALRITSLAVDNYEADDIIATLTTQAEQEGMAVQICTGDRDAIQLVDQNVTVLYPTAGVSELTRFTPEAVREKYGLSRAVRRTSRRSAATRRTTCRASPAWGRRRPPSGSASSGRCRSWSTASTRSPARPETPCGTTCPMCCRTAG